MKNSINIFSETGCISHEILWKYRQGKLTTSEKHAVEVHLTDCELCSDALAGMMNMETDEMIAGLRKGVRNLSSPKKVIRFYDYRILSAAAAVAVLFIFTYVINSSNKHEKEIAQLIKPGEKKNEQQVTLDIVMPHQEVTSASKTQEPSAKKVTAHVADETSSPSPRENLASTADADKQEEPVTAKNSDQEDVTTTTEETATGYSAPAQPAVRASRAEEPSAAYKKSDSKKKAAPDESSKIMYYNDLKVARTPAMSETEKPDTVVTGTPAVYEKAIEQSAETPVREMPFVYSKTLRDGMNYFHNNQYHEASQTFSVILERFPNDVNSLFYKALSKMEMQNYSEASALLNDVMVNPDKTFYEEAKFKLALCYIALNQKGNAEKLLREIVDANGFYSEKAAEELQQLK